MAIPQAESVAEHPYFSQITQHRSLLTPIINSETAGHGLDHAQKAADLGVYIALTSPEYQKLSAEQITLAHDALLLHDTGYGRVPIDPTGIQMEHPGYSSLIAYDALKDLPFYKEHPERLGQVLYLIYNHDNTNYINSDYWLLETRFLERQAPDVSIPRLLPGSLRRLPTFFENEKRLGKNNVPGEIGIDNVLIDLIQIVQEADGRLSDGKRTLAFCDSRRVPRFVNEGGRSGIGDQWWQGSAAANIVLAVNRLVLDTHTTAGRDYAKAAYYEAFDLIKGIFEEYQARTGCFGSIDEMLACLLPSDLDVVLNRTKEERWHFNLPKETYITLARNLTGTLRFLNMIKQRGYQTIASKLIPLDRFPKTKDSISGATEIKKLLDLREELIKHYALDVLTQLVGSLEVETWEPDIVLGDDVNCHLIIPAVAYESDAQRLTVLSGNDWIDAAKEVGLNKVRVITVR